MSNGGGSQLGKTDVGKIFTAARPVAPARADALIGALPPRPKPAPAEVVEPPAKKLEGTPKRRGSSGRSAGKPVAGVKARELVVVYVSAADAEWIEAQRRATGATNAAIILGAIQAAASDLPGEFQAAGGGEMFATLAEPAAGGRERTVQIGMRILASDRQVLENLVAKVGAPSLSALTRKALGRAREKA